MLLRSSTGDEDVIDVDVHGCQAMEDLIHESLKGLSSVSESEWHFDELE